MALPELKNDRFLTDRGLRIVVQVPDRHAGEIVDAVLAETALTYGDYDCVTFTSSPGVQSFRSLGSGRNVATSTAVEVACVELSFFLPEGDALVLKVLRAIYATHPYEEPVIFVEPCIRTLNVRGADDDNPNRFWNRPAEDWVPAEHR